VPPWYALHVASCTEALVAAQLQERGVESYIPTVRRKSLRRYRPEIDQVLMPGYVFGRFDLAGRRPVVQIPQVIRILGHGTTPDPIPDAELDALMRVTREGRGLAVHHYTVGQTVRIGSGPLAGISGIVVWVKSQARIVVAIQILQQAVSAEVDAEALEAAA
jgi:transcription antitermination factor NusG